MQLASFDRFVARLKITCRRFLESFPQKFNLLQFAALTAQLQQQQQHRREQHGVAAPYGRQIKVHLARAKSYETSSKSCPRE